MTRERQRAGQTAGCVKTVFIPTEDEIPVVILPGRDVIRALIKERRSTVNKKA